MPLFNILIRTSDRPKFFERCLRSVWAQTYDKFNVFVSVDNQKTLEYVSYYPVKIVNVLPQAGQCFWNLYFNDLLERVDGWVIYLDDDVTMEPDALETIANYTDSKRKVIVCIYLFLGGWVIPEQPFCKKRPVRKHFDTGCFCHHSSQKVVWDSMRASDFRVACQLFDRRLRFVWVDKVLFKAGNDGDIGKKNDLILP